MASTIPFCMTILHGVKANNVAKKSNLLTQGSEEEIKENKATISPKENMFLG